MIPITGRGRDVKKLTLALAFGLLVVSRPLVHAQEDEKIKKLFQDAILALGGATYLQVTDIVSDGNLFLFARDGASSGLIRFSDFTKLPDKSRNEVGNRKKELDVTVFNLEKKEGWILEGQKETRNATPEEMKDFTDVMKHSLETIFRFRYQDPDSKLFYLGAAENSVQLEMVKLIDSENDEVTIYFDRLSKLPAQLEYQVTDRRGIHYRVVDEFSQWHMIQGVNTPMRIDTSRNGRKLSQHFVLKIAFNTGLKDSFFVKPIPPK
jgi:hypothetical protein